ncbi:MAG: hypothetical protein HRT98_02600 [Mycoplasmatales bacterium]|nr:hypothetical protein [Mycoplasmatales bacterium]
MGSTALTIFFGCTSFVLTIAIPLMQKYQLWDLIRGRKPIFRVNKKMGTVDQFYFSKKKKVRFTYGVLANIQTKNDGILLNQSKRDKRWKPIGGALQFNDEIKNYLASKKIKISTDTETKIYKANEQKDMRFFAEVKETHQIDKIISKQGMNFLVNNLKREILEEMPFIKEQDIKVVRIKSVISQYKEAAISPIKVNDFNQQFVFDVEINVDNLKSKINKEDIKFFTLDEINSDENFADTIKYLSQENITPKYRKRLEKK